MTRRNPQVWIRPDEDSVMERFFAVADKPPRDWESQEIKQGWHPVPQKLLDAYYQAQQAASQAEQALEQA